MKVAVLSGKQQFSLKDVSQPVPNSNQVVVKVGYCGICGSDVHAYHSLMFPVGTILGHEFAGIVERTGSEVTHLQPGDRVVVRPPGICGQCQWCEKGELALCEQHFENTIGLKVPGGFAEFVLVEDYQALPLKDGVSFREAAQSEPLAVCLHATKASNINMGDSAVIFGAGPIGLLILQMAKAVGAHPVYVVETAEFRRRKAKDLGADIVIDPTEREVTKKILSDIPNGVNLVIDCAGKEVTINQAINVCKKGGQITLVGAAPEPIKVDQLRWLQKGIKIHASMGYFIEDFRVALECIENKRFDLEGLVSHVVSLDEIEKGFELLNDPNSTLKVLIKPSVV